jgi:RNA polymerase sigma factor (sigma-70 family)
VTGDGKKQSALHATLQADTRISVMETDQLARRFDESRAHLRAVAHRMLGSDSEAEDAVQEAWLKLSRADTSEVENLRGWLTTVVARVCLDMLRSRKSRREEPLAPVDAPVTGTPESDVAFAHALGPAMLVVLDTLAPAERVAFVLHDMFDFSFEQIATIVDRTPAAARQLASRGRRRVRGATVSATDVAQHRELVDAFLAASRDGNFEQLVAVLSPDVVLRADALSLATAKQHERGAPVLAAEVRGATAVANAFKGRARAAQSVTIDGEPAAIWASGGQVRAAFVFAITNGRITGIELVMEPDHLAVMDIAREA